MKEPETSGFVDITNELCDCNGAKGENIILPIVPVNVKATSGIKVIKTYAFLDLGSTATFCTERFFNNLNLHGR